MRRLHRLAALSLFAALALHAPASFAQSDEDKATARQLGQEGQEALGRKDFKTAEDRFARADKLFHFPVLALGLARAYKGQGKYVLAQETYNRIVREGAPPGANAIVLAALKDAETELAEVQPKIANVTITVAAKDGGEVKDPKVTLDERPVNAAALGVKRPVDPGEHVIKVVAEGFKAAEQRFTVGEGASASAPIMLEKGAGPAIPPGPGPGPGPDKPPPGTEPPGNPPPGGPGTITVSPGGGSKIPAYVAFGVGGAGLLVGAITGVLAMGKASDLDKACTSGKCPSDQQSNIDSYKSMGTISTIGFVVAGVGAAAGVVLLLTSPKVESPKTGIQPFIGPGSVGAFGRF